MGRHSCTQFSGKAPGNVPHSVSHPASTTAGVQQARVWGTADPGPATPRAPTWVVGLWWVPASLKQSLMGVLGSHMPCLRMGSGEAR